MTDAPDPTLTDPAERLRRARELRDKLDLLVGRIEKRRGPGAVPDLLAVREALATYVEIAEQRQRGRS